MKNIAKLLLIVLVGGVMFPSAGAAKDRAAASAKPFTSLGEAIEYLQKKAHKMIRASRTPMPNGVAAFPPQAGSGYEAFWLRDYAYQLEGCVDAFSDKELCDACRVFTNALRADGAGVDCVKFTGQPIYMPGYGSMGSNPVADGSQFTVDVAWFTYEKTKDDALLKEVLDKLVKTLNAAPKDPANGLIYIKPGDWDRCPYGFTDSIRKQGDELFCSLLYIQACRQLGDLMEAGKRPDDAKKWRDEAEKLAPMVRKVFWDEKTGLFLAATKLCNQPDIWGSAFAVYLDVATPEQAKTIAKYFKDHYSEIVQKGQIRHLPGGVYWHAGCGRDSYQNGGYWATPTGWFVYTLDLVDPKLADQTIIDLANDFRARGVSEWVLGPHLAVMNYLASATMPLAGVRKMFARRGTTYPKVDDTTEEPNGPTNLAYVGNGAKPATASSEYPDPKHKAAGLNDGLYGNSHSWIGTKPRSSFQIELAKVATIGRFKLGRDRSEGYGDRALGYLKIETSTDGRQWKTVFEKSEIDELPGAGATKTMEFRIAPVEAKFVRGTVDQTDPKADDMACIDEFEVYAPAAKPSTALPEIRFDDIPISAHMPNSMVVTPEQEQFLLEQVRSVLKAAELRLADGTMIYAPCGTFYRGLWPRDYEYVVEGAGDIVKPEDLRAVCKLLITHQMPNGWVPITINPELTKFDYRNMGPAPESDSAQFFVKLVYQDFLRTKDAAFIAAALEPMKRAMDSTPRDPQGMVWIDPKQWHTGYGFTDSVGKSGQELYSSLLYWECCGYIARMARAAGKESYAADFTARAALIEKNIDNLKDTKTGLYFAASGDCRQLDVWGNAYLVYIGFPDEARRLRICRYLAAHYDQFVQAGQVRHLFGSEHWHRIVAGTGQETYQDGGYWGTATGWAAYAIAQVDPPLASKMLGDMLDYYQKRGAYESINEKNDYRRNRNYSATVTLPLAAILKLQNESAATAAAYSEKTPLPRPSGTITPRTLVTEEQFNWLTEKMRRIIESVRMKLQDGTIIYSPGVYVGLWQRDCYYGVQGGRQFVPPEDLREILRLTLKYQRGDGIVPKNVGNGGAGYVCWGPPPECDSAQFVVFLMNEYFERSKDKDFVAANLKALVRAMDSMPRNEQGLIWIDPGHAHTGYGFTDQVFKTGAELYSSLLYWEASRKLAEMAQAVGQTVVSDDFLARAVLIEKNLASLWDEKDGMYFAASQDCRQTDIWGSAYAVYIGFPDVEKNQRICHYLAKNYDAIVFAGQVRHLPAGEYWKKTSQYIGKDEYQNGAYWGTASGWVAYAIAQVDPPLASKMLGDMIDYYRRYNAYECVNPTGYRKFPGYSASVGNPLEAIRKLRSSPAASPQVTHLPE